ncbi:MAG: hypothetical protein MJE68_20910, partial [Proteobacteria bacterium]|nr:hypothetical protein [Pseudomonadota bacterium]
GGARSVTENESNGSTKSGSSTQMENENNSGAKNVTEKQLSESIDFRVSPDKESAMDLKKNTESDEDITEIPQQKCVELIDLISTSQSDSDNTEPTTGIKKTDDREVVRQARSPTAAIWNKEENPRPFRFGVVGGYPAIQGVQTDQEDYCQVEYVDKGTKMVPLQTHEKGVAHQNVTEILVTSTNSESETSRDAEPKGSAHNEPQNDGEKNIAAPNTENVMEKLVTSTLGESETSRDAEPKGSAHNEPQNVCEESIGEPNTQKVIHTSVTCIIGESETDREMDPINVIQKPVTCTNNDERTEKIRKVEDKGSSHNQQEKDGEENIGQPNDQTENISEKITPSTSNGRSETINETEDDESAQNSNKKNAKMTSADGNMSGNDKINDSSRQAADGTSDIENNVDSFESTSATTANSQEESSGSEPENVIYRKRRKKRRP